MSITVESFILEDDSSIATASNITNLFVEYSFLNFEYGELETPSSQPKPLPGEPAIYNFKKGMYSCIVQLYVCYTVSFMIARIILILRTTTI